MDKEEKEKENGKKTYSSPLSPFSHASSRTSSPKTTRRTKMSNPDVSSHMISLDENKSKSRSPKLKMNLREKFRKNLFGNNSKLVRLNRASSDTPRSPSSRDFPTFHFSPDDLSHSEFGGISEHDSEIHYLEEFRNEVDRDYKPAYLCEPKSRLVTFNFAAINQQQQQLAQQQQQLLSQSQNEIEFSKSLFTNAEWKAYKKWVKLVFNKNPEYFNESRKIMTTRMTIFLHFYHLEIPITTITENYIKTQSDWCLEGYEVMNYASFIQIPLNENYSPYWWCNPYINPPSDQCPFGFSNLCHYYQTKVVDSNLNNTRMKYKKIKEELRKYIEEFESITSILTSDPFTQNIYIKLLMRWAIASKEKISHKIRLNSCIVLSHLTFPRERIVGLREKLMKSGVVYVILTYARRGELYVTQHVELNQIELDHFLDSGAVGKVHLGKWNGIDVAVKMCQGSSVAFVINEFRFEVALMTILSHPNLLPCFAAKLTSPSPYLIVSPYQSKGSLKKVLMDEFEEMSDIKKIWVAYCISNAVNYLHKYKIIHRDIKSQNILIGEEWSQVYLTDFGTSRFLGKFDGTPLESFVGTNEYMAPELLHHPEDGKAGIDYDFKADVYSFGILLFEIITRTTPYEGLKSYLIADRVIAGHRPSAPLGKSFNDFIKVKEMIELMKSCWAPNPKKRPSFNDIKHKLFSLLNKYFKGEELRLLFTSTQTSHLHNQSILVTTLNHHSPLDNHHHSSGGSLNHSGSSNNGIIIMSNNSSSLSSSGNPGLKLTDSSLNSLHPSSSKHSDFPSSECHSLIPPKKSKQKKKKGKNSKEQTANNNNNFGNSLSSSTPSISQSLKLPPLPYNRHHRYQLTHQSSDAKKDEGKLEEIFSDFGDEFTKEVMMLEQHFDKLKCLSDQGIEEELDSEIDLDFDMNGNPDELPPQTMGLPFDLNSLSSLSSFPPRKNSH